MGDTLRIRTGRHQMCEELAMGGFATIDFSRLKSEIQAMTGFVEEWPAHAEAMITNRFATEESATPHVIVACWDQFLRRIAFGPMVGDAPGMEFDPCDPQLRLSSLPIEKKGKQVR